MKCWSFNLFCFSEWGVKRRQNTFITVDSTGMRRVRPGVTCVRTASRWSATKCQTKRTTSSSSTLFNACLSMNRHRGSLLPKPLNTLSTTKYRHIYGWDQIELIENEVIRCPDDLSDLLYTQSFTYTRTLTRRQTIRLFSLLGRVVAAIDFAIRLELNVGRNFLYWRRKIMHTKENDPGVDNIVTEVLIHGLCLGNRVVFLP